jgi:hypothetical protein
MPTTARQLMLKPAIHAAIVDEHIVFLDAAAGAYLCRACDSAEVLQDRCTLALADDDLAADLLASNLAQPPGEPAPARRWAPPPRTTALRPAYPHPRLGDTRDAVVALWDLLRNYRGRSFAQLLETARADPPPHLLDRPADLIEVLDGFQRWAPYAPVTYKCLLRSFLLLRHLHRHGQDAAWVFGVTTWPFEAHCWLQVEDAVLDDELDRVARYTPIMVL